MFAEDVELLRPQFVHRVAVKPAHRTAELSTDGRGTLGVDGRGQVLDDLA